MAANKDLIAMARDLAKANGFNDIGKVVDDEIQKSLSTVEEMFKNRQAEKDKTDAYLREYLHNMPNANMQKIPENMRGEVVAKLQEEHKKYGEAARVAATLSPSDEGYAEAVQTMNGIKQKFQALDASFNQLAEWKTTQLELAEQGKFSNGNNIADRKFNAAVVSDQAEFKLGEDFQLHFKRKDDKQEGLNKIYTAMGQEANNPSEQWLGLSQLPKSTLIDEEFQESMIGMLTEAQKNKLPMDEQSKATLRTQVSLALGNDRDSIVSAATDSPIDGSDAFGIEDSLIQDPGRTSELREKVIDSYVEALYKVNESTYGRAQDAQEDKFRMRNRFATTTNTKPYGNFELDKRLKTLEMEAQLANAGNGGGLPGGEETNTNEKVIAEFKTNNLKKIEDILNNKDKGIKEVTDLIAGLAKKLNVDASDALSLALGDDLDLMQKYSDKL